MPKTIAISSLKTIALDFTRAGPGLHAGLAVATRALESDRNGFMVLDVQVRGATIPVVVRCEDLYLLGFQSSDGWWRFSDADWPLTPSATSLGHDGQYDTLGGLGASLSEGSIQGIAKLSSPHHRQQWKDALRTLLVVVAENLRLIPVRMYVLGVLNGVQASVPLSALSHYIKNWSKASKGTDMSREVSPDLRVGFKSPTLIKR